MKRIGYIYEKVCEIDNIKKAIWKASEQKRTRPAVKKILDNMDYYAGEIRKLLLQRAYEPSPYKTSVIHDNCAGKDRVIYKPEFYPDQIIHWALMLQLHEPFMRGMYAWNCGSIPGRGVHYAAKHIKRIIRQDRKNTKYCLKMDIRKFYPSIDKEKLKASFRRLIKDDDTLNLMDKIVDSSEEGVPIGNYTSQWFANWYLQKIDHLIKEELHIKYYIRYLDDMVLFGRNKKELHRVRKIIEQALNEMGLTLKGNWQVFRFDKRGLDFLGFRFFRTHTILRKRNALKIRRKAKRAAKAQTITVHTASSLISYLGWLKHCDSANFYKKHIQPYVNIKKLKEVVSNASRINRKTAYVPQVHN